jgi:uncharacterized protein
MRLVFIIVLSNLFLSAVYAQSPALTNRELINIGESLTFISGVLGEERVINVYLPSGYAENPERSYPVLYLLDGSMDEDFIHIAGLVHFGSFPWIQRNPEFIVVGIANIDRKRDFTSPSAIEEDLIDLPTSGGSAKFIEFLKTELMPLVDSTYRTTDDQTLIGQSLGGLVATEILFNHTHLFDRYIIVSPSLWWDGESLLTAQPAFEDGLPPVYIAVGAEGEIMEKLAASLFDKLSRHPAAEGQISYSFLEDQNHGDALHLAVYNAFGVLFQSAP